MTDRATLSKPAPAMLPSAFQRPLVGSFGSRGQDQFADHAEDRESGVPGLFGHSFADITVAPPSRVTSADEPEEKEADRTANEAVHPTDASPSGLQTLPAPGISGEQQPDKRTAAVADGAPLTQQAPANSGKGLEPMQRKELERVLGQNLGGVRMRTDTAADADSQALAARAFTRGADIHFRRGHFQPHTRAGRWLLTHELTHAIRSRTNVVARKGVGTPMGPAPNLRPSTPAEDREFVGLAIEFIQRGKEHYQPAFAGLAGTTRAPVFRTPPTSREQLVRQLEGWKATTTQCVTLIGTTLNNDATLDQQLRRAYRDAVEAAVSAAASHQSKSRHDIYDEHRERIHDWAWPAAVADPDRNALSDTLTPQERSQIRTVTTGITFGSVDSFFAANASAVALPQNTTARFGSTIRPALRAGLQNIAATLAGMTNGLELNSTLTLGLDLGRVGGDYVAYRFTRVRHAAQGRAQPATNEILIEALGTIGLERPRPGEVRTQRERFARLGLSLGAGWGASPDFETNAELQALLRGLAGIPDATLTRIPSLRIDRASTSSIDPNRAGEYDFATHTVRLFHQAFATSLTRFGTPGAGLSDATSFAIRHEIGHALDQISLRTALGTWNASVDRLNAQVGRRRAQFGDVEVSPNRFQIPPDRRAAWEALQRDIAAARAGEQTQAAARDAARALSGAQLQRRAGTNVFEAVQGPVAAGTSAFRQAAVQDGVRLTHYSDQSWLEYFAESYAMFISAPEDLARLRPHVFAFMQANFP
jgi:hypothetical protein